MIMLDRGLIKDNSNLGIIAYLRYWMAYIFCLFTYLSKKRPFWRADIYLSIRAI